MAAADPRKGGGRGDGGMGRGNQAMKLGGGDPLYAVAVAEKLLDRVDAGEAFLQGLARMGGGRWEEGGRERVGGERE